MDKQISVRALVVPVLLGLVVISIFFALLVSQEPMIAELYEIKATVDLQEQRIEKLKVENETLRLDVEKAKKLQETIDKLSDFLQVKREQAKQIDYFFAGKPHEGLGRAYIGAAVKNRLPDPFLLPRIVMVESGGGVQEPAGTNNAAGLTVGTARNSIGSNGRWASFRSRQDFVVGMAEYVARAYGRPGSPYQMGPYANYSLSWPVKVNSFLVSGVS